MNPDTMNDIKDFLRAGDIEAALKSLLLLTVEGLESAPPEAFSIKDITSLADTLCKVQKEVRLAEMQTIQLQDREESRAKQAEEDVSDGDWMRRLSELQESAKSL